MGSKIKILVVDDQHLVRDGIASLLSLKEELAVSGTAVNGREGLQKALELCPDVVLMDIRMPVLDGISALRSLLERGFAGKVIMLTTFDDEEYILQSLQAGAAGYLMKDLPLEDLSRAILQVHNGTYQLAPSVMEKLMGRVAAEGKAVEEEEDPMLARIAALSPREYQIFRLIGTGASNREIAGELYLSEGTIKNYVTGVLTALGLRDRTQAALAAARCGGIYERELSEGDAPQTKRGLE